jgi:hypothetical protein
MGRCSIFDLAEISSLKMEETHIRALTMTLLNT